MSVIIPLITSILVLVILKLLYPSLRRELPDQDLYKQSLHVMYTLLGRRYHLSNQELQENAYYCTNFDYYKLVHPDVLIEDDYCYRMIADTIQSVYRNECFSLSQQSESHVNKARHVIDFLIMVQMLTMANNYPSRRKRDIYAKTRCLFTTSMGQFFGDMHQKSRAQEILQLYYDQMVEKQASQACLQDLQFIPKSYSLADKQQCLTAMRILNHKFNSRVNTTIEQNYVLKSNGHLGSGLELIDESSFQLLLKAYQGGNLCGMIQHPHIVQELINKPVLLYGRKVDFRLWMLAVSIEPMIFYIYDYTMVLTCFDIYDQEKLTKYNFVCNAGVAKQYWASRSTDAVDPLMLDDIHRRWTLQQWNMYLVKEGFVKDLTWWRTHLLPTLKRRVAYYMKLNMISVPIDPRVSGLFAFDASINQDGDIKLFDFNTGPNFAAFTKGNRILQELLHKDVLLLMKRYLVQRYSKIRKQMEQIVIPKLREQMPLNIWQLEQALRIDPLPEKELYSFYYIDFDESTMSCKPYEGQ